MRANAQDQINSDRGLQPHKRHNTLLESPCDNPTPYNREPDAGHNHMNCIKKMGMCTDSYKIIRCKKNLKI